MTSKLQKDLKYEAYSQYIRPVLTNLLSEKRLNINLKELCSICSEISFQAQTDIYEELLTTDYKSKCHFLYRIEGLTREYIPLGRSSHYMSQFAQNSFYNQMKDDKHFNKFLPSGVKNFHNLPQFLLNFQHDTAEDEENEEQILN